MAGGEHGLGHLSAYLIVIRLGFFGFCIHSGPPRLQTVGLGAFVWVVLIGFIGLVWYLCMGLGVLLLLDFWGVMWCVV